MNTNENNKETHVVIGYVIPAKIIIPTDMVIHIVIQSAFSFSFMIVI